MQSKNSVLFDALRKLKLPTKQYAITGSGPIGIRDLKEMGDIDIIVTQELWKSLASRYGITDEGGIKKIVFPSGIVEALSEHSFYSTEKDPQAPSFKTRIESAEIIEGLPFESLRYTLYYKKKMGRKKDLDDIQLIREFRRKNVSICEEKPSRELSKKVLEGLTEHAIQEGGYDGGMETCIFTAREGERLLGAIVSKTFWGALHIKYLWVAEEFRGQGVGLSLMEKTFAKGQELKCPFAYVETMNFQALDFYKGLGFKENFVRHGYAHGASFYYLQKDLGP